MCVKNVKNVYVCEECICVKIINENNEMMTRIFFLNKENKERKRECKNQLIDFRYVPVIIINYYYCYYYY